MNWEKIDDFYDLDHAEMRSVPLRELVNWLRLSWIGCGYGSPTNAS
jgi:hypothetical protein